jgi:3-methyladenine DNA glycosylase/8-oxoguanine DNA glycosylase
MTGSPQADSLVRHTVAMMRNGSKDPSTVLDGDTLWRATLTPYGAATIAVENLSGPVPHVRHYGPGGTWLAERAHDLLGRADTFADVNAVHESVARAQRKYSHFVLPRTHSPYHELLPAVLGQRVTAREAFSQWRDICLAFGQRAPGPLKDLQLPPDPEILAKQPYFALHTFGIEKKRATTLSRVAAYASRLVANIDFAQTDLQSLTHQLTHIPGVGVWTAATAGGIAFGDPDALLVGDFHVKNTVAFALTGRARGTDEEMISLLQPYEGQRARVVKWLELDGWVAPKYGPRQRISSIVNR